MRGIFIKARWKGLEPSISAVTGRRFNQLSYHRKTTKSILTRRQYFAIIEE